MRHLVLLHVDVRAVLTGPHERLGDRGFGDGEMITAALVMGDQGAQTRCWDVPREGAVFLLIARVTKGRWAREPAGKRHKQRQQRRVCGSTGWPEVCDWKSSHYVWIMSSWEVLVLYSWKYYLMCCVISESYLCLSRRARRTLALSSALIWSEMIICSTTWWAMPGNVFWSKSNSTAPIKWHYNG